MREYTRLEKYLQEQGFEELYGIGLWAKEENGTAVDTNTGDAKVIPHIDASFDNFVAWAETVEELEAGIKESETDGFFIENREDLTKRRKEKYGN